MKPETRTLIINKLKTLITELESEQHDPYAEIKEAQAAGKVIQCWSEIERKWLESEIPMGWCYPSERYRIKPQEPEAPWTLSRQLPGFRALAEGEEWHRSDFTREMLPNGKRPSLLNEPAHKDDEIFINQKWITDACDVGFPMQPKHLHTRTSRPLPLLTPAQVAEGWIEWKGGENPAPGKRVQVMGKFNEVSRIINEEESKLLYWGHRGWNSDIIAYRIIEPKLIPLGPEDVPPGSVFRPISWGDGIDTYITVASVRKMAVCMNCIDCIEFHKDECDQANGTAASWLVLMNKWKINRSLSLGKWDANAWEPCSKESTES